MSVLHVSPDTVSRFVMTKLALLTYNRAHSSEKIARSLYIDLERSLGLRTLSMSNAFRKPKWVRLPNRAPTLSLRLTAIGRLARIQAAHRLSAQAELVDQTAKRPAIIWVMTWTWGYNGARWR